MFAGMQNKVRQVVAIIARQFKLTSDSLCFCGSGKKLKECCGVSAGGSLTFLEEALDAAHAYRQSQKHDITAVPLGIWKRVEAASLERLPCLYPGCTEKTVSCHLTPENVLRKNYGTYCKEFRVADTPGSWQFVQLGVGRAGCLPVFCARHDNGLFKPIDLGPIDFSSAEHRFLLAMKAQAFSLRKTQYLLGIDSQVEIARPFLIEASNKLPPGSNVTIDLARLQEQYICFTSAYTFFEKSIAAYQAQQWAFYSHFYRRTPSTSPLFFAALTNPCHDFHGEKINTSSETIAMTCTAVTDNGHLHVLLSCPGEPSKTLYQSFFEQLDKVDDATFTTIVNNMLTESVELLLVPATFVLPADGLAKIHAVRHGAQQRPIAKIDLTDVGRAVKFA